MSITKATKANMKAEPKPDTKEIAAKAVEEIMGGVQTVSVDDQIGRSPDRDATKIPAQRDYISGTRRPDMTFLPEYGYDQEIDVDRKISLPKEYAYCWVSDAHVTKYRVLGYKFALYNGGNQSGLTERGLKGTGLYEQTLVGHIRNGDCVLMFVPRRLWEELVAQDAERVRKWNLAPKGQLHDLGYSQGVRTFEEKDGQITYN